MYVYFIKTCDNAQLVKVGKAANPERRLRELQTGNASELVLIGKVNCGGDKKAALREKEIHDIFADLRVRGEWFRLGKNLREYMEGCLVWDYEKMGKAMESQGKKQESRHRRMGITEIDGRLYGFVACRDLVQQYLGMTGKMTNKYFLKKLREAGFAGETSFMLGSLAKVAYEQGFRTSKLK